MSRYFRHIISLMVFLSVALVASGRDSLNVRRLYHDVGLAASAGYNLPSHGYYNGHNPLKQPIRANSSVHLKYGFGFQPGTRLGSLYPGVTQGVGVAGCTFYSHELMGSPIVAYVFQNVPLLELKPGLSLDYAWELGGSYGWKQTELIATRANIYVNVGLNLSYDLSRHWSMNLGPEFTHCSNGDTKYPNGGSNMFNLKVGVTGHVVPRQGQVDRKVIEEYENELTKKTFAESLEYDLAFSGGIRAGKVKGEKSYIINEPFPCFCLTFTPQYRINRHFSAGASVDIIADRSANLYDVVYDSDTKKVVNYNQPSLGRQIAAGLCIKGEISMPVFAVGVGVGSFVIPAGESLKGAYGTFSLKTFMTESLFINICYRLSTNNYTHNMMYGVGVRF